MGIDRFDLAVLRRSADGAPILFLAPAQTRALDLEHHCVTNRLPWLRAQNAAGHDVYFRPHRHMSWPVVFLDDLPPPLAIRIAAKYPAAVIETSPGSCHLWLVTNRPLTEVQRTGLQKDLVARLAGAADPASVSGSHWGRLPGFRNHKPSRRCWVNPRVYSKDSLPLTLPLTTTPCAPSPPRLADPNPQGQDISRMEWGWVRGSLQNNRSPSWVLDRLILHATPRRGHADAVRYAHYTVQKACRFLGLKPPNRGDS